MTRRMRFRQPFSSSYGEPGRSGYATPSALGFIASPAAWRLVPDSRRTGGGRPSEEPPNWCETGPGARLRMTDGG